MKAVKKLFVCFMAVVMTLSLSSCGLILDLILSFFSTPEISLEYTLTKEDEAEFDKIVAECEALAMEGTNVLGLTSKMMEMNSIIEYVDAQSTIGYLEYCMNQTDPTALQHYKESEQMFMNIRSKYMALLKKMALESPLKDDLFAGFTEEEMKLILIDADKVTALQLENSELTRQFYELNEESATWSSDVAVIYEDVVENNQEMAKEYGYADYYELANEMIYKRNYTYEQRSSFRGYVAQYIVPMFKEIAAASKAANEALSTTELSEYEAVYSSQEFLNGYIDSYAWSGNGLKNKMDAMFTRPNAALYGTNENALQGAFTTYIGKYQQPIVYFGPGYQDLFTIVHEMGHYTAFYHFDNATLPYDLAEVHSQGNEWLLMAYLEDKVSPAVYNAIYLDKVVTSLRTVIYATMVDHFEELVYTAKTPVKATEYQSIMNLVCAEYAGINEALAGYRTPFSYAQHVTLTSPGYYLSYATSEIASVGLYLISQGEDGYEGAQSVYIMLQEGVLPEATFTEAIAQTGLPSPFEASTFVRIQNLFMKKE